MNTHETDKTVILSSQAISLLEDPLSKHSEVVILSSMDKNNAFMVSCHFNYLKNFCKTWKITMLL